MTTTTGATAPGATRRLVLGLAGGSGAALLAGCGVGRSGEPRRAGSGPGALAPTTIQVHHWENGIYEYVWGPWVERFEAQNPGVRVQSNVVSGAEYHTKMKLLLAAGTPPDFFFDNANPEYAYLGALEVLDPYLKADRLNAGLLHPFMVSAKRWKGALVGLPGFATAKLWQYNAEVYREAGVPDPNQLYDQNRWRWSDFLDAARKVRQTSADGQLTRWHGNQTDYFSVLAQNKAAFLSTDLRTVTIGAPEAIEAFQFLQDAIWKDRIHPGAAGTPAAPPGGFFATWQLVGRDSWASIDAPRKEIAGYPRPFAWDVAPLPSNKARATIAGVFGWTVPKDSPRKEHGWALARFLTFSPEIGVEITGFGMPPLKEAGEAGFAKMSDPKGARRAALEPYEKGTTYLAERFTFPRWQEFSATASTEIGALLRNEKTPRAACEAMATELRGHVQSIKWE